MPHLSENDGTVVHEFIADFSEGRMIGQAVAERALRVSSGDIEAAVGSLLYRAQI